MDYYNVDPNSETGQMLIAAEVCKALRDPTTAITAAKHAESAEDQLVDRLAKRVLEQVGARTDKIMQLDNVRKVDLASLTPHDRRVLNGLRVAEESCRLGGNLEGVAKFRQRIAKLLGG